MMSRFQIKLSSSFVSYIYHIYKVETNISQSHEYLNFEIKIWKKNACFSHELVIFNSFSEHLLFEMSRFSLSGQCYIFPSWSYPYIIHFVQCTRILRCFLFTDCFVYSAVKILELETEAARCCDQESHLVKLFITKKMNITYVGLWIAQDEFVKLSKYPIHMIYAGAT